MPDEIESNQRKEDMDRIDRVVHQLSEHYCTVHVFVSRHEGDKDQTRSVNRGSGSWFSRYGQIREWLVYEDERIRECARQKPEA
jgi:hypothetical protein